MRDRELHRHAYGPLNSLFFKSLFFFIARSGCLTLGIGLFIVSGPTLSAAPQITGAAGNRSQGGMVTLTGNGFGVNADGGPMLWDDFEGGIPGGAVADDAGGAVPAVHQGALAFYGGWKKGGGAITGKSVIFNPTGAKARSSLHARATFTDSSYWGLNLNVSPYAGFTTGKEILISFYYRMTKTDSVFPRQSKAWIAYDSDGHDKSYWSTAYENCELGGYRTHITELPQEHGFSIGGKETEGEWMRFETHLKQSGPDVADGRWVQTLYRPSLPAPALETFDSGPAQKMRTSAIEWVEWTFGGAYYSFCGSAGAGHVDLDDFYIDDTQARVELCDSPSHLGGPRPVRAAGSLRLVGHIPDFPFEPRLFRRLPAGLCLHY